ncbi:MAG: Lrp/AsnC ligand binding domain-containing protein [Actinomycetota bacterium]
MRTANAYLLVQTDGHVDRLAGAIRDIPGVVFAEDVRGPYDAIALVRSDAGDGTTLQWVLEEIRSRPGVVHALAAPRVTPVDVAGVTAA